MKYRAAKTVIQRCSCMCSHRRLQYTVYASKVVERAPCSHYFTAVECKCKSTCKCVVSPLSFCWYGMPQIVSKLSAREVGSVELQMFECQVRWSTTFFASSQVMLNAELIATYTIFIKLKYLWKLLGLWKCCLMFPLYFGTYCVTVLMSQKDC